MLRDFVALSGGTLLLSFVANADISPYKNDSLRIDHNPSLYDQVFTRRILEESMAYGKFSQNPTVTNKTTKVGIIGAGGAGLYSAILLESLGIDYEILEATNRTGGRIWTYYFNETAWNSSSPGDPAYYDYYDVGAMRFPGSEYMDRVIGGENNSLINHINSKVSGRDIIQMIPYIFTANNTYRLYNGVLEQIQAPLEGDPFRVNVSDSGTVPDAFAALSPKTAWAGVLKQFTDALTMDFNTGFDKLMEFDSMSVREYFIKQNYTDAEVDWLETVEDATGHCDLAMSQMVLEQWVFGQAPLDSWVTVEGGLSRIINGMVKSIKNPVNLYKRIIKISPSPQPGDSESLAVQADDNSTYIYDHVINTVPLGAMQIMDMDSLNLEYGKKLAIRKLSYDPAGKIGMKFKTRWWEDLPQSFKGGQTFSDLPIRRCVYPSYGVNTTGAAATMIASYTWGQDSSRLGSYINSPTARAHLIEVTLRDLALMNNVSLAFLQEQYLDSHVYSWYNDEFSVGAFAIFSPGQFSSLLPALLAPAANGRLHFAGEALSSGHAWIIGALNSAYRSVAEILAVEGRMDLLEQFVEQWGVVDEVDLGWYNTTYPQPAGPMGNLTKT
ncbi:MAG: hypothetical protein M1812_003450 [Candelaria pacifica]|nr:MAG: hypothetical protein M1812_003450 [Candelaria pacifica]